MKVDMPDIPIRQCDVLIIGGGISGLWCALHSASKGKVIVVNKGSFEEANTFWAQGGMAVALYPEDTPQKHFTDTVSAGAGLCREDAVWVLVKEAPQQVLKLWQIGVPFDANDDRLLLTIEGAHSERRIAHAFGDATGRAIMETLPRAVEQAGVKLYEHTTALSLLTYDSQCVGALVMRDDNLEVWESKATVLATGGSGQLFASTTNPKSATGEGIALAFQAGAKVADMEFVQFHPTALMVNESPRPLISEAMRGEGAILLNLKGERFMQKYHPKAELAPRDIVARAIFTEMQESDAPYVLLDISHKGEEFVKERFPNIYRSCLQYGFNVARQPIPVSPASHYHMGGVWTDLWGRTSLPRLFACGECACTGLHGANRLASNSLTEGLVFGYRVAQALDESLTKPSMSSTTITMASAIPQNWQGETKILTQVQQIMDELVGVVRWEEGLQRALSRLTDLGKQVEGINTLWVITAWLITYGALERKESRGCHYRKDFPDRNDEIWRVRLILEPCGNFVWNCAPKVTCEPLTC